MPWPQRPSVLAALLARGGTPGTIELLIVLLALSVATALVAQRLRFPYTLALVIVGLVLGFARVVPTIALDPSVVLFIFLPALLFEGAWNADAEVMRKNWLPIALLAIPGLLISLGIVATTLHVATDLPWLVALLVGAIVSPTDPIAVVALMRQLGMPARLRVIVEGESLFNDGVGAAVYLIVLGVLLTTQGGTSPYVGGPWWSVVLHILWLFVGGPLIGLLAGIIIARFLHHVEDHLLETAITFGAAYGVYFIADSLATSGLLAVVTTGLILGTYGRRTGITARGREAVDTVWEFTGYLANSLLFLLVGLQIGASGFAGALVPIAWAVVGVVLGRALMIFLLFTLHDAAARWVGRQPAHKRHRALAWLVALPRRWRPLLLLSGVRGALSLALVLSLPSSVPQASLLTRIVYGVVLFTLLVQGISLRLLLPRWPRAGGGGAA